MTTDVNPIPTRKRARILVLLTALLAGVQFGAAVRTLQVPQTLVEKISLPLPLDFIASLLWTLISLAVMVLLWRRERRARLYAAWLAIGFSIYSLLRLLLFSQSEYDRGRFPFLLVVVALLTILPVAYIVRFRRTNTTR
jgi:hypothetical protein